MSENLKLFTLNRAPNPNAPYSVGNAVAFADAAGTAPVDGTGGAPTVTITRTESSPLEGNASYLFTKDAANRQGEGWSENYILQPSDATKMFTLTFDYQLTTGTYTGYQTPPLFSDLTAWVYDVTNAVMYQVMGYQLDGAISTTNQYSFRGQWQVPVGCLQARLIFFLGNTTAVAFTARFNNISFGRRPSVQGSVSTPSRNNLTFTPNNFGTVTNNTNIYWYRSADTMFAKGYWTNGTVVASTASLSLPSGYVIDSTKLGTARTVVGTYTCETNTLNSIGAAAGNWGVLFYDGSDTSKLYFAIQTNSDTIVKANGSVTFNSENLNVNFAIPIVGWGANGTLGQDADTRALNAQYTVGATSSFNNATPINYGTKEYDNFGGITTGAGFWRCTVPVAGLWNTSLGYAGDIREVLLYKNGSVYKELFSATSAGNIFNGSISLNLNAGDYFDIRSDTGTTGSIANNTQRNWISVSRSSGPAQVQANEIPKAGYNTNAAQSIANGATAIVDFEDKIYDTFGLVTVGTWKFNCNRAGIISVSAMITYASGVFTLNNTIKLFLYKNGVLYETLDYVTIMATVTDPLSCNGVTDVQVVAGDYLDVRTSHGEATARSLTSVNTENYIAVKYTDGY